MKKDYMSPTKKDLVKGSVLEIYLRPKEQKRLEGRARLIERLESRVPEQQRSYVRKEIGCPQKQEPHTIIWSWEKWLIEFIDGPNEGWRCSRKIAYFVTINSYYESGA